MASLPMGTCTLSGSTTYSENRTSRRQSAYNMVAPSRITCWNMRRPRATSIHKLLCWASVSSSQVVMATSVVLGTATTALEMSCSSPSSCTCGVLSPPSKHYTSANTSRFITSPWFRRSLGSPAPVGGKDFDPEVAARFSGGGSELLLFARPPAARRQKYAGRHKCVRCSLGYFIPNCEALRGRGIPDISAQAPPVAIIVDFVVVSGPPCVLSLLSAPS